jgi:hypothetical protein
MSYTDTLRAEIAAEEQALRALLEAAARVMACQTLGIRAIAHDEMVLETAAAVYVAVRRNEEGRR